MKSIFSEPTQMISFALLLKKKTKKNRTSQICLLLQNLFHKSFPEK